MLFRLACTVALLLFVTGIARSQRPDDVYAIGQTTFAYYGRENKTEVSSKGIAVFDNSRSGFQYIHGAQRVELYLLYEFKGHRLTQEPSTVTMAFESRSSESQFNKTSARAFQLFADGNSIARSILPLDKSTLIGYITWEQSSMQLPIADFQKFLTAKRIAAFSLGHIAYSFSDPEFARLKDFVDALRQAATKG